jgi:magnesium transporter
MHQRILVSDGQGTVFTSDHDTRPDTGEGWAWIDITTDGDAAGSLPALAATLDFDAIAMRDAVEEEDLPKVDDFGNHLLVVLHGLRSDVVETYEVDCFVTAHHLVTVHAHESPSIDALWGEMLRNPALGRGTTDVLLARLADVLTRRLLSVLDLFEDQAEGLIDMALAADPRLLGDLVAVRSDLTQVRRIVNPQRETLDQLRTMPSPLVTTAGRRRFSDVFDLANRTAQGLESARTELAEILDAYRGAEARKATDITKVLTVYAAIMLPLSLVTGFFGMNFVNLPGIESPWGWVIVTAVMVVIAAISIGVFVSSGWIRRPSGRAAGAVLGRGLIEAARAPATVGGAVLEISSMPLRATTSLLRTTDESGE